MIRLPARFFVPAGSLDIGILNAPDTTEAASFPQGLKPAILEAVNGAAEAAPFQNLF